MQQEHKGNTMILTARQADVLTKVMNLGMGFE